MNRLFQNSKQKSLPSLQRQRPAGCTSTGILGNLPCATPEILFAGVHQQVIHLPDLQGRCSPHEHAAAISFCGWRKAVSSCCSSHCFVPGLLWKGLWQLLSSGLAQGLVLIHSILFHDCSVNWLGPGLTQRECEPLEHSKQAKPKGLGAHLSYHHRITE